MLSVPLQLYVFNCTVVKVVDGDTLDCDIDLGLHCHRIERVRLLRVNAPEMTGASREAGLASKKFVEDWLTGQQVIIKTYKSDAFGRYLAEVWRTSDGASLNDALLDGGWATPF